MIPHKQLYRHKPDEGIYGDCDRTVIACLLDMRPEDVPHWGDPGIAPTSEDRDRLKKAWLAKRGYALIRVVYDGTTGVDAVMTSINILNPGIFYQLSGISRNGVNHVVICLDGEILHDPAIDNSGITGPCDDGYIYVEYLTPISQVAEGRIAA